MSEASISTMPVHHTISDRLRLHAAWGVAAVVFWTFGWFALQPWDPRGPVSMLAVERATLSMIEIAALAAVMAAVATVIAGRVFADIGVAAVGIAIAIVSLRGGPTTTLLVQAESLPSLCLALAAEGVFWFLAMTAAVVASAFVMRWVLGEADEGRPDESNGVTLRDTIASEIPFVRCMLSGLSCPRFTRAELINGLLHAGITAFIALALILIFAAGGPEQDIRNGQSCFAVAAAFYIAAGRAQIMFPARTAFWSFASVVIVCVAAYVWAMVMSLQANPTLPTIPTSGFLRVLPVTYVAVGAAGVVMARWRVPPSIRD